MVGDDSNPLFRHICLGYFVEIVDLLLRMLILINILLCILSSTSLVVMFDLSIQLEHVWRRLENDSAFRP